MKDEKNELNLMEFPCDFMIKVMGKADSDFEKNVMAILERFYGYIEERHIKKKYSKDHHYLSLSVTVFAQSKAQLNEVYDALTGCDDVLMRL